MQKEIRKRGWARGDDRTTGASRGGPKLPTSQSDHINAKRKYEHYLALANATAANGDVIATENYYQHAEHYFRRMKELAV